MTDQVDLDKLRELAQAATPGPWQAGEPCAWDGVMQASVSADDMKLTWDDHSGDVFKPQDAEFIAAANPAVVLELLARIARVEALHQKQEFTSFADGHVYYECSHCGEQDRGVALELDFGNPCHTLQALAEEPARE